MVCMILHIAALLLYDKCLYAFGQSIYAFRFCTPDDLSRIQMNNI